MANSECPRSRRDVDHGFAWIVLIGASTGMSLFALAYTGGIFNVIFLEVFGMNKQTTAWLTAVQSSLWSLGGPLSSIMNKKLGSRCTCIVGGIIGAMGYIMTFFANGYAFTFFSFGIVVGIGFGICYVPCISITSVYFEQKRSLAFGLINTAIAVGTMVFPMIIMYCKERFGWRGCMLLLAGLYMQQIVAGALFKPNEQHLERTICINSNDNSTVNEDTCKQGMMDDQEKYSRKPGNTQVDMSLLRESKDSLLLQQIPLETPPEKPDINTTTGSKHSLHFMKIPSFLLLCVSLFGVNVASFICYVHFPALFVSKGATGSILGASFMGLGISNIFCRLVGGIATNSEDIDVIIVYISSCGLTGILMFVCPLMSSSYTGQMAFTSLFGFYGNWAYSLIAPITVKLLNVEDLPFAFGMVHFCGGFGGLIGPPFAGWLFDVTESYDYSFYTAGIIYLLSAVSVMIVPILKHDKPDAEAAAEHRSDPEICSG